MVLFYSRGWGGERVRERGGGHQTADCEKWLTTFVSNDEEFVMSSCLNLSANTLICYKVLVRNIQ